VLACTRPSSCWHALTCKHVLLWWCRAACRFLGIQLVIVLNQNLALLQQQNQAAGNGQAAAAAVPTRNSGSGSVTPLRKQSSGALSPRRVSLQLVVVGCRHCVG
jgi:hypothetical protein